MQRVWTFSAPLLIVLSAAMSISARAQTSAGPVLDNDRIKEIFRSTLARGEYVVDNEVLTSRFVPPSDRDVAEIKSMGAEAIPALARHLNSQNPFEQFLALRILGMMGGKETIKPLGDFLLSSAHSMPRRMALRYLSEAPWDSIREYVMQAENDVDPTIRREAQRIRHAHE